MIEFTPALLDDIRNRLPVSDVVGRHVKLRRQGREWIGLSPFSKEKTPSFTVNDQKGFYHCFSSGKHGDQFRFLMEVEGLSFPEAVEKLAREAGVRLPERTMSQSEKRAEDKSKKVYEALEQACLFFEANLAGASGKKALTYLIDRGLDRDTIKYFRLGTAPAERQALRAHLEGKGFGADSLIAAGLLIHGEDIAVPYDRFRNRLMIPILDNRGRVIAFGARALDADTQPKYLNSPETLVFHKGANLYFSPKGREKARAQRQVYLVEGYLDVIAMVRAGFEQCAAPLGTALTDRQLAQAWKLSDHPLLCFDGDKAGLKAAIRALRTALPLLETGRSLSWVILPDGCDPDDILRESGQAGLTQALQAKVSLTDMLWQTAAEDKDLSAPEQRASFEKDLFALLADIKDTILQRHLRQRLEEMVHAAFFQPQKKPDRQRGVYQKRTREPTRSPYLSGAAIRPSAALSRTSLARQLKTSTTAHQGEAREAAILRTLIHQPRLLDRLGESLGQLDLSTPDYQNLLSQLITLAWKKDIPSSSEIKGWLYEAGYSRALERLLNHPLAEAQWASGPDAAEVDALTFIQSEIALHRKLTSLKRELRESTDRLGSEPDPHHYQHLMRLSEDIARLEGVEVEIENFGKASLSAREK